MKALDSLRIFVITQRKGSLSAAGRSLSLSPATISRRISALEEELGVQLVDRTSRNLKMTEAGQAFLGRAEAVLEAMAEAEEAARSSRSGRKGGCASIRAPRSASASSLRCCRSSGNATPTSAWRWSSPSTR